MKDKIIFSIILFLIIPASMAAQKKERQKISVSVHSGVYVLANDHFKEVYNSRAAFINGVSLGVPFTNIGLAFYAKGMYFQRKGTPIIDHYEIREDGTSHSYTTREGDAAYREFLFNLGIQYSFSFKELNKVFANGGVSFIAAKESVTNTAEMNSSTHTKGYAGCFLGLGYERLFKNVPISVFGEAQYDFDRMVFNALSLSYGGANINLGCRFYF